MNLMVVLILLGGRGLHSFTSNWLFAVMSATSSRCARARLRVFSALPPPRGFRPMRCHNAGLASLGLALCRRHCGGVCERGFFCSAWGELRWSRVEAQSQRAAGICRRRR
jgi:hypothetical protein